MRRRIAVAVLVAIGLLAGGGAGAQTTTTTSTTSSSTTTSVVILTTTSTSTTSTTFPNPCAGGRPCADRPPDALLSGVSGEVRLDRGSSCWTRPNPDLPGGFVSLCADVFDRVPDSLLVVRVGETLSLRFDTTMTPTFLQLERGGQATQLTPGNPARFAATLPVGVHVVHFFTRWSQGDAGYSVRLDVRAATTASPPRVLALTG